MRFENLWLDDVILPLTAVARTQSNVPPGSHVFMESQVHSYWLGITHRLPKD